MGETQGSRTRVYLLSMNIARLILQKLLSPHCTRRIRSESVIFLKEHITNEFEAPANEGSNKRKYAFSHFPVPNDN